MGETGTGTDSDGRRWGRELACLAAILCCAALGGLGFRHAGMPAPYLLGSMFGVWIVCAVFRPARPFLNTPRWFYKLVTLGLGVLIGAMFAPDVIDQLLRWGFTVGGMLLSTVVATLAGYWFLTRFRRYEPTLALFCAMPGGQAEVIALSREMLERDYVVALCHLVRVVVIFCLVPLMLALLLGTESVAESNRVLSNLPGVFDIPPGQLLQFAAIAATGYVLGRLARIPIPHLMGPLFLSTALHLTEVVEIPRINEFVFLAQVTIGGTVGSRLGQVDFRELAGYLRDALLTVALLLIVFVGAAWFFSRSIGFSFFDVMLAFVPGGLYEVTMLSMIFGFDVAFVATHHAARMLFILLTLPMVLKLLRRWEDTG